MTAGEWTGAAIFITIHHHVTARSDTNTSTQQHEYLHLDGDPS